MKTMIIALLKDLPDNMADWSNPCFREKLTRLGCALDLLSGAVVMAQRFMPQELRDPDEQDYGNTLDALGFDPNDFGG